MGLTWSNCRDLLNLQIFKEDDTFPNANKLIHQAQEVYYQENPGLYKLGNDLEFYYSEEEYYPVVPYGCGKEI